VHIYRWVHWVDVEAPSGKVAAKAALKAMRHIDPDPRLVAVSNGWLNENEPLEVETLGYPHQKEMIEVSATRYSVGIANVWMPEFDLEQTKKRYNERK
jgi:hypothetical protein